MGFLANFVLPAEIAAKRVKNLSPRRRRRRADAKLTQTLLTVSQAVFIKTRPARQKKRRKNVIKKKEERDRLFSCSAHVIGFVASVDNENDNRRLLFCSFCFFLLFSIDSQRIVFICLQENKNSNGTPLDSSPCQHYSSIEFKAFLKKRNENKETTRFRNNKHVYYPRRRYGEHCSLLFLFFFGKYKCGLTVV